MALRRKNNIGLRILGILFEINPIALEKMPKEKAG
jgi:hypothetical protein